MPQANPLDELLENGWEKQNETTYMFSLGDDGPTLVAAADDRAIRQFVRQSNIRGHAFLLLPRTTDEDQQISAVVLKSEEELVTFAIDAQQDFEQFVEDYAESDELDAQVDTSVLDTPARGIATGWHSYASALLECVQAVRYSCSRSSFASIDDSPTDQDVMAAVWQASFHITAEIAAGLKRCKQQSRGPQLMDEATEILAFQLMQEMPEEYVAEWGKNLLEYEGTHESFIDHLRDVTASDSHQNNFAVTAHQAELVLTQLSQGQNTTDDESILPTKKSAYVNSFQNCPTKTQQISI